ncbi:MAG: hypothetical protein NC311_10840 [Muribaculaceae bacterium]|nr:hypothetical protein [Muribaculaceae bacterium]
MAKIEIEISSKGNNKVSATNSVVNSISEKNQQIYNDILEKIKMIKDLSENMQKLYTDITDKVNEAVENVENSIKNECQDYVDTCKEYAISDNEINSETYSAKHYAEVTRDWAVADDVIEETENGEELYSAKHYAEVIKETAGAFLEIENKLKEVNN